MSYRHRCSSMSLAGLAEGGYTDLPRVAGLPAEVGGCQTCGSLTLFLAVVERVPEERLFFVCRSCHRDLVPR